MLREARLLNFAPRFGNISNSEKRHGAISGSSVKVGGKCGPQAFYSFQSPWPSEVFRRKGLRICCDKGWGLLQAALLGLVKQEQQLFVCTYAQRLSPCKPYIVF